MKLTLTELQYRTATEELPCEACEMFWSIPKPDYTGISVADIHQFFKARFGKIRNGERYLELIFVDEDEELFAMNVLPSMHKFMYMMGFYPEFIQDSLIEYKRNFKIKQDAKRNVHQ